MQGSLKYLLIYEAQEKGPYLSFVPLKGEILSKACEAVKRIGK
tara:strand:+ start:120 stop:248 length:129 start_codon:yes stop_codon:yes gene_type:complete